MTGFPLLRLPFLPSKDIFGMMDFDDLLNLQFCSAKTCRLLKAFKKSVSIDSLSNDQKNKLSALAKYRLLCLEIKTNGSIGRFSNVSIFIEIDADDGIKIRIADSFGSVDKYMDFFPLFFTVESIKGYTDYEKSGNLDIDGLSVPMLVTYNREFCTFWTNQSDGLKTMVKYFKGLFNSQSIRYSICGSTERKFTRNLRTAIQVTCDQTIETCRIVKGTMHDDDYKLILDNVNPTYRFVHDSDWKSQSDDFRHTTSFKSKKFTLNPANWFTFDNLITSNCGDIDLLQSRFTNYEMREYLKLWIDGNFPNLKRLTVELQGDVNLNYIFSGVKIYSKIYTPVLENDIICIKRLGKIVANFAGLRRIIRFNIL